MEIHKKLYRARFLVLIDFNNKNINNYKKIIHIGVRVNKKINSCKKIYSSFHKII